MSEGTIILHCSPTLAGMKTGNMFWSDFVDEAEMRDSVRHWNRLLSRKGICVLPLTFHDGRALIYVYRPSLLDRDLKDSEAARILAECGYPDGPSGRTLAWLIKRLGSSTVFPHEVGLFLGHPPEDVRGFIENKAANYKYVGTWKVYGDVDTSRRTFQRYKKCTEIYCREHRRGTSIERLTVAGQ